MDTDDHQYCCMASWSQWSGYEKVTTYACDERPDSSWFDQITSWTTSVYSDIKDTSASSGYESGSYCAQATMIEASVALVALIAVSMNM
jgi:hypothetical protein